MTTVELTTLHNAEEAMAFLLAVGTVGPTLHPNANVPDLGYRAPYRWTGWNETMATGTDAEGQPVIVGTKHYSNSDHHPAYGGRIAEGGNRLGGPEFAWQSIAWPVVAFPALAIIRHPEWTPVLETETVEVGS